MPFPAILTRSDQVLTQIVLVRQDAHYFPDLAFHPVSRCYEGQESKVIWPGLGIE
jgi:hypothetical protein